MNINIHERCQFTHRVIRVIIRAIRVGTVTWTVLTDRTRSDIHWELRALIALIALIDLISLVKGVTRTDLTESAGGDIHCRALAAPPVCFHRLAHALQGYQGYHGYHGYQGYSGLSGLCGVTNLHSIPNSFVFNFHFSGTAFTRTFRILIIISIFRIQ